MYKKSEKVWESAAMIQLFNLNLTIDPTFAVNDECSLLSNPRSMVLLLLRLSSNG